MTATIPHVMTRSLLGVWNERDHDSRVAAMAQAYDSSIVLHEPEHVVHGLDAVDAAVQRVLDGAPGWVFAPVGDVVVNDDLGRLEWQFGPAGEPPVVRGADTVLVGEGKIKHLYVQLIPAS